jgi:hypothetical protein
MIMHWRSGDICFVIGKLLSCELHMQGRQSYLSDGGGRWIRDTSQRLSCATYQGRLCRTIPCLCTMRYAQYTTRARREHGGLRAEQTERPRFL